MFVPRAIARNLRSPKWEINTHYRIIKTHNARGQPIVRRNSRFTGVERCVHGPKKTEAQIQRQRDELNRAVIAAVSSTRKDVDVTQAGLAEQMAWSREIVSNIEQGRRDVTVADLVLIARALDVDPEKLFRRILRW